MAKKDRELGSNKEFEIGEDGSISYFTDEVSDELRETAEAERKRMFADQEKEAEAAREEPRTDAGQIFNGRELGTPEAGTGL